MKRHDVEAKIKIGAEAATLDSLLKIEVAGHDESSRASLGLDAADRLELAGFDDAQQGRLLLQTESVDFV